MVRLILPLCLTFCSLAVWPQANESPPSRQMRPKAPRVAVHQVDVPPTGDLIPFIDSHAHLNDPDLQLELMRKWGATHAVVFWGGRSSNESVAAAARAHPTQLIPFASVSPERTACRPAWTGNDPGLLKHLDTLLATGLYKGIGEISAVHFPSAGFEETDFSPLSPTVIGILELARKHKVPVMLHVENTRMIELGQLLLRFRDVPVIWAHGGYTPLFLARRMLQEHPNLYYELSARTWPRHPRSPEYTILRDGRDVWPEWLQFIEEMPHRFLVGTDASNRSASADAMKFSSVQNFLVQLSPAAREQVGRGTLGQLLGLRLQGKNDYP